MEAPGRWGLDCPALSVHAAAQLSRPRECALASARQRRARGLDSENGVVGWAGQTSPLAFSFVSAHLSCCAADTARARVFGPHVFSTGNSDEGRHRLLAGQHPGAGSERVESRGSTLSISNIFGKREEFSVSAWHQDIQTGRQGCALAPTRTCAWTTIELGHTAPWRTERRLSSQPLGARHAAFAGWKAREARTG